MNPFSWLKARYSWRWVGMVEGPTQYVDKEGNNSAGGRLCCYWNLFERGDGKRDYTLIGFNHGSALALRREAEVKAWHLGGPLPPITTPEKPKATLIVLNGGRDGS